MRYRRPGRGGEGKGGEGRGGEGGREVEGKGRTDVRVI